MSEPEALPNGDADHDHPDIYGSLNAMERAFHIILCTVLDELEPSQRERIRKSLDVYRRELLEKGMRNASKCGSARLFCDLFGQWTIIHRSKTLILMLLNFRDSDPTSQIRG